MKTYKLLGYDVFVPENDSELKGIVSKAPEKIFLFAFDTETNTWIDMTNRNGNNIDVVHDLPFLVQFGFKSTVCTVDLRLPYVSRETTLWAFEELRKRSVFATAHNVEFDMNMLLNIGYDVEPNNLCDSKTVARLALESKSEREGGYTMALKPLASRLLGSEYASAGHALDDALRELWQVQLRVLSDKLKPYGITRAQINTVLKDPTGTLEEFPEDVQRIWTDWTYSSRITYADVPTEILYEYGSVDVILVLELMKLLLPIVVEKKQQDVLRREQMLIMPLVRMERTGFTVDKKYILRSKRAIVYEIDSVKAINAAILGKNVNPNQHAAIKTALLEKFGYNLQSTSKDKLHILIQTDTSMPQEVKDYLTNVVYLRTLEKWLATYINPMLYRISRFSESKVYTMYDPNGAVSGRFTSNFQQFPKNAIVSPISGNELFHPRKMFIVDDTSPELAYIDYSQIELRLQAEYTYRVSHGYGDKNMLRAYCPFQCHKDDEGNWIQDDDNQPWKGVDLHTQSTLMAFPNLDVHSAEFKKMRYIGKRVNFALIYGASLRKVQEAIADADPEIVKKLYYGFHERFRGVAEYGQWVSESWVKNCGWVENMFGRRYYITESKDAYKLNNYLIQGSAADLIKVCIIRIDRMLRRGGYATRLQGCIHDELCVCVANGEHDVIYKIKDIMEHTADLYVPIVAEIETTKTSWAEKCPEGE